MLTFDEFRGIYKEDATIGPDISKIIDQMVDDWAGELKREIITGAKPAKRGMWDRFKNLLSNVWYGRHNPDNPYQWINKYGDVLGQSVPKTEGIREETLQLSLNDYKNLREVCENLENQINEENLPEGTPNLRIIQIIDSHANILKQKLKDIFAKEPDKKYEMPKISYSLTPEEEKIVRPKNIKPIIIDNEKEKEKEKEKPPSTKANPKVNPADLEPKFDYAKPPTKEKQWHELTTQEKDAWNIYGGGVSERSARIGSLAAQHGVDYPMILRLGDPRIEMLKRILPTQKNKNKSVYDHLKDHLRIELENDPILSRRELEKRVDALKKQRQREPLSTGNFPVFSNKLKYINRFRQPMEPKDSKESDSKESDSKNTSPEIRTRSSFRPTEEPIKKSQEEPSKKSQEEPSKKAQEEPSKKAQEEPIKKSQEEPSKKAQEEPSKKAQEEPAKKAQEEPAKKAQEKTSKNAKEEMEKIESRKKRHLDSIADDLIYHKMMTDELNDLRMKFPDSQKEILSKIKSVIKNNLNNSNFFQSTIDKYKEKIDKADSFKDIHEIIQGVIHKIDLEEEEEEKRESFYLKMTPKNFAKNIVMKFRNNCHG